MAELIAWARGLPLSERSTAFDFCVLLVEMPRSLISAVDENKPVPQPVSGPPRLVPDATAKGDSRMILPLISRKDPTAARLTLGRADTCDLVLPLPDLSRVHAYFHRSGGEAFDIEDAGSTYGTLVDGQAAPKGQRVALRNQARLSFGKIAAEFRNASAWRERMMAVLSRL